MLTSQENNQGTSYGSADDRYTNRPHTSPSISHLEAPADGESVADAVAPLKVTGRWALLKSNLPEIGRNFEDRIPGTAHSELDSEVQNGRKKKDNVRSIFMAGIDQKVRRSCTLCSLSCVLIIYTRNLKKWRQLGSCHGWQGHGPGEYLMMLSLAIVLRYMNTWDDTYL